MVLSLFFWTNCQPWLELPCLRFLKDPHWFFLITKNFLISLAIPQMEETFMTQILLLIGVFFSMNWKHCLVFEVNTTKIRLIRGVQVANNLLWRHQLFTDDTIITWEVSLWEVMDCVTPHFVSPSFIVCIWWYVHGPR